MLANPKTQRARLFDAQGKVVADSEWVRPGGRQAAAAGPGPRPTGT